MTITTRPIEYKDGKTTCIGYLAWDETYGDPKPCVLINHAWGGLDGFAQDKAIQMAALGYVGFCLDNYGDGALPETVDEKMALMGPLKEDRSALLKRLKAGYKAAAALDEVDEKAMAVMGFCFGGLCSLDMARAGMNLEAAISFHGLLDAPDLPKKKIKSKVLIAHGWDDPMAKPEAVLNIGQEMTAAKCDWQLLAYGQTSHAFTVPEANDKKLGLMYNAVNAQRATMAAQDLLSEVFGQHGIDQA
jgi:dienelactone hydrolase